MNKWVKLSFITLIIIFFIIINYIFFSYGTINITSNIPSGKFILDGKEIGTKPPIKIKVKKGEHILTVKNPSAFDYNSTFTVKRNESKDIYVKMQLNYIYDGL